MKKITKLLVISALITGTITLTLFVNNEKRIYFKIPENSVQSQKQNIPEREKNAFEFLIKNMSKEGMVYTNFTDDYQIRNTPDNLPSGKDVLSESQGIMLLYLLNRSNQSDFNRFINYTTRYLYTGRGIFKWVRYKDETAASSNALIDDLRLMKGLILADEKWPRDKYGQYARKISNGLIKNNVRDGYLVDYYSLDEKKGSNSILLSYLDMGAIKMAAKLNHRWESLFDSSYEVLMGGMKKDSPFLALSYDIERKAYYYPDEVCLVQMLYILINMHEAGINIDNYLNWIYYEYQAYGKLYSKYTFSGQRPIGETESTAIYAIAARLFYLANDAGKANEFIKEAERFQVMDEESSIYGAFGNKNTLEVYSFDNLQYLYVSSLLYPLELF